MLRCNICAVKPQNALAVGDKPVPIGKPRRAGPARVATVAMANKTARTIWAIMARGDIYRAGHRPALAA